MKKKIVSLLIAGVVILSFTACGSSAESTSTSEKTSSAQEESTQEESTQEEPAQVEEENGMRKEPVYTNTNLDISGETGPFTYDVSGIQVSKLTATTDESAELLGIEKDKEVCLVVIDASAENTTDDTNYFYIGQATLTSDTKEQVESDVILSDYIDGEFIGNVIHNGSLTYILPNSSADDIKNVSLHVDAPSDNNLETIGDEVTIDISLE